MSVITDVSPIEVEKFLKGITYPADKQDLIDQAKKSKAPSEVMEIIEKFADREYGGTPEVAKEVAEQTK